MALKAEKEELAKLAEDPLKVNPDDEARKRLQQLRNQQQQFQQRQQQQEDADDEDELAGKAAAAAGVGASGRGGDGEPSTSGRGLDGDEAEDGEGAQGDGEEGGEGDGEVADPYAGMSARQRKLHDLRQKLQQCRKANEHAIIAERKRMKVRQRVLGVTGSYRRRRGTSAAAVQA